MWGTVVAPVVYITCVGWSRLGIVGNSYGLPVVYITCVGWSRLGMWGTVVALVVYITFVGWGCGEQLWPGRLYHLCSLSRLGMWGTVVAWSFISPV
jgi:hypothetical protein